ncbi:hypothetical protein [Lyngbya sp. PCC 8106]|uniref:hypothetical protein n=1 Tax=Lyngbya sp. (strain PCC 8106) TaxID=313612 RepID=UPI0000EA95BB|nr:hypothetical protein [Lyngbya sp. PCC 8106]EAW35033.1 hypothetical protein L8106_07956 [Lyngbya sp. PCC 8106]
MSTSVILLFWAVVFLLTIPWLVKIFTGRREEAISEIIFLFIGLLTLWFVGGAIAIVGGKLDFIFQTWFAQVRLSETQKQLIQGAALVVAAIFILNIEKILLGLKHLFSRILTWIRKD